jgi:hypothetical protein
MNDQERQLVVEIACVIRSLVARHDWADHDVTEQKRKIPAIGRRPVRTSARACRPTHDFDDLARIDGKCKHIRRTRHTHVFLIELCDVVDLHEKDAQFGSTANSLISENGARETLPSLEIDRYL